VNSLFRDKKDLLDNPAHKAVPGSRHGVKAAILFVALLLLVACGGADAPVQDADAEVQGGAFTSTLVAKHSGKCLDLKGGSSANGTALEQESCSSSEAPNFEFTSVSGKSNTYLIKNARTNKCLDIYKGNKSNGTRLIQYSCGEGANQHFKLVDAGGGYYQLVAGHSNKCLDVYRAYKAEGTQVTQYTCHSAAERGNKGNQLWKVGKSGSSAPPSPRSPTPPPPSGGDSGGGSSSLAVTLMGKAPEKKTVTFKVDKPQRADKASLRLRVYDADKALKGKLYINGNGPIKLFGDQATSANHNTDKTLTFSTPSYWWKDGNNRLEFVHDRFEGFRISTGEVSFSTSSGGSPAPSGPSAPVDRSSYALRGDPGFSKYKLSTEQRRWYDELWRAIDNPGQLPFKATALAKSDDSFTYRGDLQDYITSLLLAFRMTGDLRLLDEVDRLAQLMRAELEDGWRGTRDGTNGKKDGFLNWVNRHDTAAKYAGKDTQMAYDLKANALVAMIAWALQNNRDLKSPGGVNYGAHADFWKNYLVNHFEAKWRKRNGKPSGFPFADHKGLHTYHSFMKWHYYMGKLTGKSAYTNEAKRMMNNMWDGKTFKDTSSSYGTALVWTRGVMGNLTQYDKRSQHNYLHPQDYARYIIGEVVDLHFEKFDRYASSSVPQKMARSVSAFVIDNGSSSFARDIGGGRSRAGIPASSSRWGRMSKQRFAESSWSYLAAWDSASGNKIGKVTQDVFYVVSNKKYGKAPRRVYIPTAMLMKETLR